MPRKTFPESYHGGRVFTEQQPGDEDTGPRYPCFATGCPMAGTIFAEHSRRGSCAWHYGVVPNDIPRVTNALRAWECVAFEIDQGRAVLTGPLAMDAAGQDKAFTEAWARLKLLAGVWQDELAPGNLRTSKGVERPFRESYGDWIRRLERFIGARVVETLTVNQRRAA